MSVDKLVDSTQLDADLTSVANAIRTKGGTSASLSFPSGFVDAVDAIQTGGGGNWTLIGTKVFENLSEYTNTTAWETFDTGIDIKNTDYAWIITIVTCDSAITTSTEWGMTIALGGRYVSNGAYYAVRGGMQKGTATISKSAMTNGTTDAGSYGVNIPNNTGNITIARKCHTTGCPKIRAGNYTVKVYGMTAF